ncbi:MAG: peptidoglycan-binding outer membrane protein [Gammaproteobacteria bacterium]|jgi:OOP family OmpA-OmpF porin|nr:peptidoglycan-binding outer membrane protein [Gammaproteobacteria bacterium]
MKKALLSLAVAGAVLGGVNSASALSNVAGTYYLPLEFGVYHSDPTRNINNSAFGSIGAGYNFTPYFALQANAGMMNPSNQAGSALNGYLFDVEGKFSMPTQTNIMPYALLGAGYMQMVSKNGMADGGLGVAYALGPNLNANATYRMAYQFGQGKSDSFYTVGLSFNFGASSSLPASTSSSSLTAQQQAELAGSQKALRQLVPAGVPVCTNGKMSPNQAGCVTFNGNVMTMHLNVKFDQNMAVIRPEYYGPIARLGDFMTAYPNTTATLYGYASSEGPLAFNQGLSTKRAQVVDNYLVNVKHIDASRLTTKGMGISNPIADNSTNAGRILNRRVEADVPVPVQVMH